MIVVDRKAPWILELAWLVAWPAELRDERAFIIIVTREYLHSMVAGINDEQETLMVERQAGSAVECTISIALFLGADRELDSRVTIIINTITFHVSQRDHSLTLTLTTTKRCAREMQEGGDVCATTKEQMKRTAPTRCSRRTRCQSSEHGLPFIGRACDCETGSSSWRPHQGQIIQSIERERDIWRVPEAL